ncbi:MAG: hypothetical protein K2H92_05185, partial [Bacteroidaceae bacterium]|nr:hypothetical protein [Bacteroidaceae bacterium]
LNIRHKDKKKKNFVQHFFTIKRAFKTKIMGMTKKHTMEKAHTGRWTRCAPPSAHRGGNNTDTLRDLFRAGCLKSSTQDADVG